MPGPENPDWMNPHLRHLAMSGVAADAPRNYTAELFQAYDARQMTPDQQKLLLVTGIISFFEAPAAGEQYRESYYQWEKEALLELTKYELSLRFYDMAEKAGYQDYCSRVSGMGNAFNLKIDVCRGLLLSEGLGPDSIEGYGAYVSSSGTNLANKFTQSLSDIPKKTRHKCRTSCQAQRKRTSRIML